MSIKNICTISALSILLIYLASCTGTKVYNIYAYQHKQNKAMKPDSAKSYEAYYTLAGTKIRQGIDQIEYEGKGFKISAQVYDSTKRYNFDIPSSHIHLNGVQIDYADYITRSAYTNYAEIDITFGTDLLKEIQKTSRYRKQKNETLKNESNASKFYDFTASDSPVRIDYKLSFISKDNRDTLIIPESTIYMRYMAKEAEKEFYNLAIDSGYYYTFRSEKFEKEHFSAQKLGSYTLATVTFPIWIVPWLFMKMLGLPKN